MSSVRDKKTKIIHWYCPFLFSIAVCILYSTYLFNRPVTGFVVGIVTGWVVARFTQDINYNDFWSLSATWKVENYFIDDKEPVSKATFFFFFIWFHYILSWVLIIFVFLLILGSIAGIIALITSLIQKGF